ncbi:hypothetical protein ACP70R_001788 [Stipagrostis hirtigluma subsp. patula]
MAVASAVVALLVGLLVLAASPLPAVAAPAPPPPPAGLHPYCNTTCGGLNLTCDTSYYPPRLLLGTLQVVDISLESSTMHVIYQPSSIANIRFDGRLSKFSFGGNLTDYAYMLSSSNELVVYGRCSVEAMLVEEAGESKTRIIGGCSTPCTGVSYNTNIRVDDDGNSCKSPLPGPNWPIGVRVKWRLESGDHALDHNTAPPTVFVAEKGWFDLKNRNDAHGAPLVLEWRAKKVSGLECRPGNTSSMLCKSENSVCKYEASPHQGYLCSCREGYEGNPYLPGGCQDVDECQDPVRYGCFGKCTNKNGSYECQCPRGSHGNFTKYNGCVKIDNKGLISGIGVGSGAGSILLVVLGIFMARMFKHTQETKLKQKYFKQNRGQLLQQLISQKADIAERMIISVDELAKATNNFDKARELGGGGHGTVYKGILSDLHVVAIKKSKIVVQKEIDDFINEVAILSQINHRNIVKLYGCCLETEVPLLIYEFIPNGTLYQHLHVEGPRSLPWETRLRIATETSSALAYLHFSVSTPIIHRDIKSSNILLDDSFTSKVSDFGASRYIPIDKNGLTTKVQGTIGYLDPVYFYTWRLTDKSDVYSFGVILMELLTRKKPFSFLSSDGDGLVSHFVNLLAEGNVVQILDPQVIEEGGKEAEDVAILAASCTKLNSDDRPTIREVEHALQGLEASKKRLRGNMAAQEFVENNVAIVDYQSTKEERYTKESSRRYSMEEELLMSARYPR